MIETTCAVFVLIAALAGDDSRIDCNVEIKISTVEGRPTAARQK